MSFNQAETPNLLLRALSGGDYELIQPHLERRKLCLGEQMFERDEPIERVHFLECGVGSVVAEQGGGEQIEVGIYGREGLSATAVLLGAGQSPLSSMIQIGHAVSLSIASDRLLEACHASRSLHDALLRYVQSMEVQAALTAVSNARYTLTERLARWLLMCHDRVDGDQLELTHRFMSMMLAVRRSGVTVTIHTLEAAGSIKSARGLITIADRSRLEEIAGNAYGQAEAEYRRLVAPFGKGRGAA